MARRWYVVQTNSCEEIIAVENLKNQRFIVFYPQLIESRSVRGNVISYTSPLFPSYLFVQFDIKRTKWRSVNGTRGVRHILGATEEYASPVPRGFVEELIKTADKKGIITIKTAEKVMRKHRVGDQVRITNGLFQGYTGTCRKIQEEFAELILALQSGSFKIKLPLSLIETV